MTICNYCISFYTNFTRNLRFATVAVLVEEPPKTDKDYLLEKNMVILDHIRTVSALKLDANDAIILD